jgi:hypothetical protein
MRNVRSGTRRKMGPFPLPHPEAMRFLPKTVRNKILKTDLSWVGLFFDRLPIPRDFFVR